MKTELLQKKGLNSRKFILHADKITIETKTFHKINKYDVRLDNVGLDLHFQSENTIAKKIGFWSCIAALVGSVIMLLLTDVKELNVWIFNIVMLTIISCIIYYYPHQDDIYLVGGHTNLVFFRNVPNEKIVLDFIDNVKSNVKNHLRVKYTAYDSSTSEHDFYNRLNWLKDCEVISQAEYIEYKTSFHTHKLL
jgi:galactitol-specific phosphotransferase system IIC component